jgi:hypothetical protein
MSLHWLTWSNPVAVWWGFLIAVSAANIMLWLLLHSRFRRGVGDWRRAAFAIEPLLLLSAAYVFGCAFRSFLPRADVQRICLFDTFLSSVAVGRSVATIAEICFVVQWAIVLRELARMTHSDTGKNISFVIVPLIVVAECFSWYSVITTDFLGNLIENSIWTVTFGLIAVALLRLVPRFHGLVQWAIAACAAGIAAYVVFMSSVDVPMYYVRWQGQLADGREFLGAFSGLYDAATRWVVTHDFARWKSEIAWMSLYFSVAVWSSLALAGFALVREHLPHYRVRRPLKFANRPVAIPVPAPRR